MYIGLECGLGNGNGLGLELGRVERGLKEFQGTGASCCRTKRQEKVACIVLYTLDGVYNKMESWGRCDWGCREERNGREGFSCVAGMAAITFTIHSKDSIWESAVFCLLVVEDYTCVYSTLTYPVSVSETCEMSGYE